MKYIYSGPASGVTLADGQEVLLWPNSEISLPEDNEWVMTMVARRHLTPSPRKKQKLTKRKLSMAANYLHGVETIEIETGLRPVKAVKSAVIGLIGTAPCGRLTSRRCVFLKATRRSLVRSGKFHHPQALKAIYDHGAGTVVVINVLNPAVHKSTIPSETVKVDDNGQIQLKHGAVQTMNIGRSTNAGNAYIKGTDYTIDMLTGKITCMGINLKPGVQAYVNYTYAPHQSDCRRYCWRGKHGG